MPRVRAGEQRLSSARISSIGPHKKAVQRRRHRIAAFVTVLAVLVLATPAFAHRLDEYLQATTITVGRDEIDLRLRLTAGVTAASQVLSIVDANGDGRLSEVEQRSYADRVRRDLTLSIDGRASSLRLTSFAYPDAAEIRSGLGDIVLTFSVALTPSDSLRALIFENHHHPAAPAFLVNTLVPVDTTVHILAQQRNRDQSSYRLSFAIGDLSRVAGGLTASVESNQSLRAADRSSLVATYFWHGVKHILSGYDHLLFLAALVLGAVTLWDLVKVVTAFTIAHSMTLTLAALDLGHLPSHLVEPLIAASIVFVAVQNIVWPNHAHGRSRLVVAFFFGLFHGLGFAGGLLDVMHQMPTSMVLLAILGFSLGVEAGNQIVLVPLFACVKTGRRLRRADVSSRSLAERVQQLGSAGISIAGVYYLCLALAST